jgi:thiol-disulfide isomerase/thioredoxin
MGTRQQGHPPRRARAFLSGVLAMLAATGLHAQGFDGSPWPAAKPVPELQARDLQGQLWRISDLRGKAVLINFWASWCAPCQAEMPSLQALARAQGPDTLVVLAVNVKESAPVAQRFVQRTGLDLPVLLDPEGAIARQWQVRVFPSTVLIAPNGQVKAIVRGELDWTGPQAAALVEPLLRPAAPKTPSRQPR